MGPKKTKKSSEPLKTERSPKTPKIKKSKKREKPTPVPLSRTTGFTMDQQAYYASAFDHKNKFFKNLSKDLRNFKFKQAVKQVKAGDAFKIIKREASSDDENEMYHRRRTHRPDTSEEESDECERLSRFSVAMAVVEAERKSMAAERRGWF